MQEDDADVLTMGLNGGLDSVVLTMGLDTAVTPPSPGSGALAGDSIFIGVWIGI